MDCRPPTPGHPFRQALKTNDQRAWTPTSPMLLCAGNGDPAVLYLNTELMQNYWSSATTVTVLDIDSAVASGDPYEIAEGQLSPLRRNSWSWRAAIPRCWRTITRGSWRRSA